MDLQKTGLENQIKTRRKSSSAFHGKAPAKEGQAADFFEEILSNTEASSANSLKCAQEERSLKTISGKEKTKDSNLPTETNESKPNSLSAFFLNPERPPETGQKHKKNPVDGEDGAVKKDFPETKISSLGTDAEDMGPELTSSAIAISSPIGMTNDSAFQKEKESRQSQGQSFSGINLLAVGKVSVVMDGQTVTNNQDPVKEQILILKEMQLNSDGINTEPEQSFLTAPTAPSIETKENIVGDVEVDKKNAALGDIGRVAPGIEQPVEPGRVPTTAAADLLDDSKQNPSFLVGVPKEFPVKIETSKIVSNPTGSLQKGRNDPAEAYPAELIIGDSRSQKGKVEAEKDGAFSKVQAMLKGEGEEKNVEGSPEAVDPISNAPLSHLKNPTGMKLREEWKPILSHAGPLGKEGLGIGDIPSIQGDIPVPTLSNVVGLQVNATTTDRTSTPLLSSFEHLTGALSGGLFPEQPFIIKKYSPSSLEVTLQPEGLGKVNIELKMSDHHLNAQILVHDNQGKELLEKTLPQLLSDLNKGGFQIGEFNVSLRNQGRDQNPDPSQQPFSRGQPSGHQEAGIRPSSVDDHLIHIII